MSIATIDWVTYETLLNSTIARYRRAGLAPSLATQRAQELMSNAFRTDDPERDADLDARDAALGLTD